MNRRNREQEGYPGGDSGQQARLDFLFKNLYVGKTTDEVYQELDSKFPPSSPTKPSVVKLTRVTSPIQEAKIEPLRGTTPVRERSLPAPVKDQSIESITSNGAMPTPYWVELPVITLENGNVKKRRFVGIDAPNIEGVFKRFAWWVNYPLDSRTLEHQRRKFAVQVARMRLAFGIDAAVGPGIQLYSPKTKPNRGTVEIDHRSVGMYVDVDQRERLKVLFAGTLPSIDELKKRDLLLAETTIAKAVNVLPDLSVLINRGGTRR